METSATLAHGVCLTSYIQVHLEVSTVGMGGAQCILPNLVSIPLGSTKEKHRADVACGMECDFYGPLRVEDHIPHIVIIEQGGHRSDDQHCLCQAPEIVGVVIGVVSPQGEVLVLFKHTKGISYCLGGLGLEKEVPVHIGSQIGALYPTD